MNSDKQKVSLGSVIGKFGIILILVGLCIILTILTPAFAKVSNLTNILRQVSITGVIAVGMTFVIVTGGIDLSVGSITGVVAMVTSSMAHPGDNVPLAILVGIVVGLAAGALNGFIIAYLDIAPFISTLGLMTSLRGVAQLYNNGRPINDLSDQYNSIGGGMVGAIPVPVIIFLVVIVVGFVLLKYTRFGRHVYAVGGNELSAKVSGINVRKVKLFTYMIVGLASAISGIVISSRVMCGSPNAGEGYEMDAITACVIGGASLSGGEGSVLTTIIGALIVGVMNNGLDLMKVSSYWQQIVKGAIIVVAVLIDTITKKRRG